MVPLGNFEFAFSSVDDRPVEGDREARAFPANKSISHLGWCFPHGTNASSNPVRGADQINKLRCIVEPRQFSGDSMVASGATLYQ